MDQYAGFVIAAYAIAFGAVAMLVGWVVLERRAARAELERAERTMQRGDRHAR